MRWRIDSADTQRCPIAFLEHDYQLRGPMRGQKNAPALPAQTCEPGPQNYPIFLPRGPVKLDFTRRIVDEESPRGGP